MERGNLSFLDRVLMLLLLDITQIGICYDKLTLEFFARIIRRYF